MALCFVRRGVGGCASIAAAGPIARVLLTTTNIQAVDVATQADATISLTGFASDSLAMDSARSMFSANSAGDIYNVTAPMGFYMGSTGYGQIGDLDFAGNGLWGFSNASQTLFYYDFGVSAVTYSASITGLSGTVRGVAHRAATGDIYLSESNGLNADVLYKIAPSATVATVIGGIVISDGFSYVSDIDFDAGGGLVAMSWFHRDFYQVNLSTAGTTLISAGPLRDATAMALAPEAVPEPATLLLLGTGATLGIRRRHAKRTVNHA